MTVTQYKGPRMVPLVPEPGQRQWDKTKSYEYWTLVQYQGASYISVQNVPVGVDITNENYWLLSANYNSQVEQYRREVADFDGRISNAQDSADKAQQAADNAQDSADKAQQAADKANSVNSESWHLIIGDSWTQPRDNPNHPGYTNWIRKILANNPRTKTYGAGGATFDTVLYQLDDAINDSDYDNDQVTDIFMVCGVNVSYEAAALIEGANKVADKVYANFKNARLIWASNGHSPVTDAYIMNLQATNAILQSDSLKCGFVPLTYYLNSPANYSNDENDYDFYGHKIGGFHLDDYSTGLMVNIYNNAINGTPQQRVMYNANTHRDSTNLDVILELRYIDTTEKYVTIPISLETAYEIRRDTEPSLCNIPFDLTQIPAHTMNFIGYTLYISADTIGKCTIPFGYRINNCAGGTYPAPFATCQSNFGRVGPKTINEKDYYKYIGGEFYVEDFKFYNIILRF